MKKIITILTAFALAASAYAGNITKTATSAEVAYDSSHRFAYWYDDNWISSSYERGAEITLYAATPDQSVIGNAWELNVSDMDVLQEVKLQITQPIENDFGDANFCQLVVYSANPTLTGNAYGDLRIGNYLEPSKLGDIIEASTMVGVSDLKSGVTLSGLNLDISDCDYVLVGLLLDNSLFPTQNQKEFFVEATQATFTWTNVAVPEPSTYAAILGALALGFVAYRRRK